MADEQQTQEQELQEPQESAEGHTDEPTAPVNREEDPRPFEEHSVTDRVSVDYPGPDDLRGHVAVEHEGETVKCPVCQAEVPLP